MMEFSMHDRSDVYDDLEDLREVFEIDEDTKKLGLLVKNFTALKQYIVPSLVSKVTKNSIKVKTYKDFQKCNFTQKFSDYSDVLYFDVDKLICGKLDPSEKLMLQY